MLSTLPPTQRTIIELIIAGSDAREIADLLGKTPTPSGRTWLTPGNG